MIIDILKWTFAIVGHLGLWSVFFNRIHATAWPRRSRKRSEKLIIAGVFVPMIWVLAMMISRGTIVFDSVADWFQPAYWYGTVCTLLGCFFCLRWCWRRLATPRPASVISHVTENVKIRNELDGPLLHGRTGKIFNMIPGNQATELAIEHVTFALKNCPPELDGLRVCHISDLHFLGQLDRRYFDRAVHYANAFQPDLVLITGDIVDAVQCLDWIETVLGKLKSVHGVYYVLGNHDRRITDEELLRNKLKSQNIIRAGGNWITVEIGGQRIHLAGNELPWYTGAENLALRPPQAAGDSDLKILLSHSPDQIDWALPYEFDLMLAGHTHGGQIRFPVVGAVIAPSKYGVKYSGGTYEFGQTVMHVSRGLSGDDSIRINCPPELGCFTLRSI